MAPEKAPAFQFYPRDFLMDGNVQRMTLAERGAYITLLCLCWQERVLPADAKGLARMLGVTPAALGKLWPALERCFQRTADGWTHKRLDRERLKQEEFRRRGSDAGKASANKRATQSQHDGNKTATEPSTKPQPKSNSSISDLPSSLKNKKEPSPKEPANPQVSEFLKWFPVEYKTQRHGADYLVKWERDSPLVKVMLKTTSLERLQKLAKVMLSDKCDEPFIVETDRGIQILSTKFNWLSDRLAAWESRVKSA